MIAPGQELNDPDAQSRAIDLLSAAAVEFERLSEPGFWSFTQQKLALAYRAAGNLTRAQQHIDAAMRCASADSPLQCVRLQTAQAHVLSSDVGTREEGLKILSEASAVAARSGLGHQLDSIRALRSALGERGSVRPLPIDPRRTELRAPSTGHRTTAT
jgi:hypothetical protein